jgi:hemerythrin
MDFIKWSNSFSVDVEEIDSQHKHLVSLINGLHEVMKRGAEQSEVEALLQDLLAYTEFHFDAEERLMAKANYPDLEEHRAKHAAMKQEVKRLLSLAKQGGHFVSINLMQFLKNWLSRHIVGTDKQYSPAMRQAGIV